MDESESKKSSALIPPGQMVLRRKGPEREHYFRVQLQRTQWGIKAVVAETTGSGFKVGEEVALFPHERKQAEAVLESQERKP